MQYVFLVVGIAVFILFVLSLFRQAFLTGYHQYAQPFKWDGFADIFKPAGEPVGKPNWRHHPIRKTSERQMRTHRRDFTDSFFPSSSSTPSSPSSSLNDDMFATGVGMVAGSTGIAASGNLQINGVELFNTGSYDDAVQFDTLCDTNYSGMNDTSSWDSNNTWDSSSCGSNSLDM